MALLMSSVVCSAVGGGSDCDVSVALGPQPRENPTSTPATSKQILRIEKPFPSMELIGLGWKPPWQIIVETVCNAVNGSADTATSN
jgi:hypothetical protein